MTPRLARVGAAPPVRIVHLGLGNFMRAHLARYTDLAPDHDEWGIAAFTGHSTKLAEQMSAQGGCYTLVTRGPAGDEFDVVNSISRAHAAAEHDQWLAYFATPGLGAVSLTVTEAGYAVDTDAVRAELTGLQRDPGTPVTTVAARLIAGLAARRNAGFGPITLIPCDNLPGNGQVAAAMLAQAAEAVDPALARWIGVNVSCVDTMVDRITPRPPSGLTELVAAATGAVDDCPVVTEPFSEWVLAGDFPAGRPDWQAAGATFATDAGPYEQRKLWLLNGAHSLLAYAGLGRGHETVAEAFADPEIRRLVQLWWDEAARHVDLPDAQIADYRQALTARFANPRIEHRLDQIAADGSLKLLVRIVPVLLAERGSGRPAEGAIAALSAWIAFVRQPGRTLIDPAADELGRRSSGSIEEAIPALLGCLDERLAADDGVVAALRTAVNR